MHCAQHERRHAKANRPDHDPRVNRRTPRRCTRGRSLLQRRRSAGHDAGTGAADRRRDGRSDHGSHAGAGAPGDDNVDERAASNGHRVLHVAHIDGSDNLDPATTWFVDALARRSGGALTAEVSFTCCGRDADVEQALLDQVRSGGVELGWVGVRAFAQAGTTAFEPLLTPLLIRSYAAEQAVVGSDVAGGLLAQLEPLGLVGLGLLPGSLRYPMSTGAPLTMPADWEGQPAYVFESQIGSDAIVALGATPVTVGFDERDERLADGSIVALDNTVRFHAARVDLFTNLVADVPLWSRVSALVAGPTTEFTAEEQRWIAEAVADVAARTTELGEIDREEAGLACAVSDPGYVLAGPEGIAAYETALEPVEAELAADPDNAAILEALHELVAGIPAESPVTCERVGDVPDTSGITLRTLIAAPVEHPSLSGANDGGAGRDSGHLRQRWADDLERGCRFLLAADRSRPSSSCSPSEASNARPSGWSMPATSCSRRTSAATETRTRIRRRPPTSRWARRSMSSMQPEHWRSSREWTRPGSRWSAPASAG